MRLKLIKIDERFNEKSIITSPNPVDAKTSKFTDDGVFSEKIFGKMNNQTNEYACKCGKLNGKYFINIVCKACSTPVQLINSCYERFGWVELHGFKIISPLFFVYFEKICGPAVFGKIINYKKTISINGLVIDEEALAKEPYANIGLLKFIEIWREVLDFYFEKRKDKDLSKFYNTIIDNQDKLFLEHIPVISAVMRPAIVINKQITFDAVNTTFNFIVSYSNLLIGMDMTEKRNYRLANVRLFNIQTKNNEIFKYVLNSINGKDGFLRSYLLGTRINFSARCVIVPNESSDDIDEVKIPYLTFLELYKFHIINVLVKSGNVSFKTAHETWMLAQTKFNPTVYAVMDELLRKNGGYLPCLINRNPTINFGSILSMRLTAIHQDMSNCTMAISNNVLKLIAGDYDGDVLTLIPLFDQDMEKAFACFSPKHMAVSRNGIFLNKALRLGKDHCVGLSALTEFDLKENCSEKEA